MKRAVADEESVNSAATACFLLEFNAAHFCAGVMRMRTIFALELCGCGLLLCWSYTDASCFYARVLRNRSTFAQGVDDRMGLDGCRPLLIPDSHEVGLLTGAYPITAENQPDTLLLSLQ